MVYLALMAGTRGWVDGGTGNSKSSCGSGGKNGPGLLVDRQHQPVEPGGNQAGGPAVRRALTDNLPKAAPHRSGFNPLSQVLHADGHFGQTAGNHETTHAQNIQS